MRNPNGYGTVVKLSGNRRKPYAARKTVGWKDDGNPIIKAIGYYATRKDAMIALAEYNRSPYDLDKASMTTRELYNEWTKHRPAKLSTSSIKAASSAWNHLESIYDTPYANLRLPDMQKCVDNCNRGYATQKIIKVLLGHLDKYAMELEIIRTPHSALVSVESAPETSRTVFTDAEIERLWGNLGRSEWSDVPILLLYSGWRISELLGLTKADIDLTEMTMRGGVKTKSGKNRIVPIHERIQPLIIDRYNATDDKLFKIEHTQIYYAWESIMRAINAHHTPHECRHTFRSRLDSAGANKVCIDLLMGHKSESIGERVYTHKTIDELRAALALLV